MKNILLGGFKMVFVCVKIWTLLERPHFKYMYKDDFDNTMYINWYIFFFLNFISLDSVEYYLPCMYWTLQHWIINSFLKRLTQVIENESFYEIHLHVKQYQMHFLLHKQLMNEL